MARRKKMSSPQTGFRSNKISELLGNSKRKSFTSAEISALALGEDLTVANKFRRSSLRSGLSAGEISDYYGRGGGYSGDTSENTNASNQQVWAFLGDSLMQTSDTKAAAPTFSGSVYQSVAGTVSEVTDTGITGVTNGSFIAALANEYYKATSKKMVAVRATVGGSKVYLNGADPTWWTTDDLREGAELSISQALSTVGTTKVKGIFTCLGINDATASQDLANIETAVNSYFQWINDTYPNIPVYVIQIGRNTNGEDARVLAIRGYISAAVALYSQMHMVAELTNYLDVYQTDLLHLNSFGVDRLAINCINTMRDENLIANTPISRTYGAEAQAVFAYDAFASLSIERKNILSDLIQYLNDVEDDWVNIGSLVIPLLGTQAESLQDLKRSTKQSTLQGISTDTPTWSSADGIRTNGGAILTNFIPSTDGGLSDFQGTNNFTNVLIRKRYSAIGTKRTLFGGIGTTADKAIYIAEQAAGGFEFKNNAATAGTIASGTILECNSYGSRRNGSGSHTLQKNAVSQGSASVAAVASLDKEIAIGALNNNGTLQEPFDVQVWGWVFTSSQNIDPVQIIAQMRLAATKLSLL